MVIINLAMKLAAVPPGIFIQPPQTQMQMQPPPLSNFTNDRDASSSGSKVASDGTTAINSWNEGFSMLILSLSFFCSKLTSWMNPASIIIIILLTLNLMNGLDGHLWRELMSRPTTLWDRNGSLGQEERVVETQARRNTNEETLVESETPTKEGKKNESETRPSSIDKEIVEQVTKRLAEDSAKRPRDPGQEARERIKEPAEIESEKAQKSKTINDQVKSQSSKYVVQYLKRVDKCTDLKIKVKSGWLARGEETTILKHRSK